MIITRTPYRISLCGGGSDYPAWYQEHGGAVLTTTIDRYCYVLLRRMPPFLGARYRVFWSRMEMTDKRDHIVHPGVRGCLQYLGMDEPLEVNHAGDLPARSGLGSSSAFTVGMLHALYVLNGRHVSRARLADEAIEVEQGVLKETVGIQDQIECAWGGINMIEFGRDGGYAVRPINIERRAQMFEDHLVLVFTDLQRYASEIAQAQVENARAKQKLMYRMVDMVPEAVKILKDGMPVELGQLLHEAWMLKRQLSDKVTNERIDEIYQVARQNGAIGGKILGAGGGGFMLLCVHPIRRQSMLNAIGLYSVPVKFEYNGSQVVLGSIR